MFYVHTRHADVLIFFPMNGRLVLMFLLYVFCVYLSLFYLWNVHLLIFHFISPLSLLNFPIIVLEYFHIFICISVVCDFFSPVSVGIFPKPDSLCRNFQLNTVNSLIVNTFFVFFLGEKTIIFPVFLLFF